MGSLKSWRITYEIRKTPLRLNLNYEIELDSKDQTNLEGLNLIYEIELDSNDQTNLEGLHQFNT